MTKIIAVLEKTRSENDKSKSSKAISVLAKSVNESAGLTAIDHTIVSAA